MIQKNLLLICYDIKDFEYINQIDITRYHTIIIASDDYRVHEESKKLGFLNKITFLQKPIPYNQVADDVIRAIHTINNFYSEVAKFQIFDEDTLLWPYHVEGGDTTQKIQDTLLCIKSLDSIMQTFNISDVILIDNPLFRFQSNIINEYSLAKKLTIRTVQKYRVNIPAININPYIRPIYDLLKTVYIKIVFEKNKPEQKNNAALVWLFNNHKKHIENCIFLDTVLKKSKLNPIFFTWKVAKIEDKRILEENICIQRIETYLTWFNVFKSIANIFKLMFHLRAITTLYDTVEFTYQGININPILKKYILQDLLLDAPNIDRFQMAFNTFSNVADYKAIPGDLIKFKIGRIVENILKMDILRFSFSGFMEMKDPYLAYQRKQYSHAYWKNFIYFMQNEKEKENLMEQTSMEQTNIVIYGGIRGKNDSSLTKEELAQKLNIPLHQYNILLDFPRYLSGYQSIEEILLPISTLLDFIKNRSDIALIIKPHPSADLTPLKMLNIHYTNVYILEKNSLPDLSILLSDIVISKFSTIGLDAIFNNSLVISPQFDKSEIFELFGDVGQYVYNTVELTTKLEEIFSSQESFDRKMGENVQKVKNYLLEQYPILDTSRDDIIRNAFISKLNI